MKANTQVVQKIVLDLASSIGDTFKAKATHASVVADLKGLASRNEAQVTVQSAMEQFILQGHAKIIHTADGKRNDTTSNCKRGLESGYNAAYPSNETKLVIRTKGKGENRTITMELVAKAVLDNRAKFEKRIATMMTDINATEAEAGSLTSSILGLYDSEQARIEENRAAAKLRAEEAKATAHEAITARVSAQLEAAGVKVTKDTLAAGIALQAIN